MAALQRRACSAKFPPMPSDDPISVALAVAAAFDSVGIAYFLGGSMASSLQGEPRSTNDIDFVISSEEESVAKLSASLGPDFDVDDAALRDAVRTIGSWNIFHLPSMLKIDLFVLGREPFDRSEFSRRRRVPVRADGAELFVKTPEDSILRKLRWYLDGGGVSDRQWRDVVEVLRVSGPLLDVEYLDLWAKAIGVAAVLVEARAEADSFRPGRG